MLINRAFITPLILASLVAAGCNNKTKDAEVSVPVVETVFAAAANNADFERLLTVDRRKVKAADAKIALAKFGLGESQDGPFKWGNKSSDNGDFTYKNLTATGKDGEDIKIAKLTLTGAHMKNDEPSFDRIDISGLNVSDEDALVTIERVSLARPSPALGASVMQAVEVIQTSGKFGKPRKLDGEDIGFGALLIDNLTVTSGDANITLNSAGWGEDEKTKKAIFLLEDVIVSAPSKGKKPALDFTLGSISATGIDMAAIRKIRAENEDGDINISSKNLNPFSPMLEGFSLSDLSLSIDNLDLKASAIETVVERKGSISTFTQTMAPVTLEFSERPKDKELVKLWEFLKLAGYEQIEISGSAVTTLNEADDSFEVKQGVFKLKDGFDLGFAYKGHGLKALAANTGEDDMDTALESTTLDHADISLKDRSIVARAIAVGVEKQGLPEVFVRMLVKGSIMGGGAMIAQKAESPAQEAAISDMVNALGGFIDNGGTISIGLAPETPVSAGELKDTKLQSIDPERLGLTITHKK